MHSADLWLIFANVLITGFCSIAARLGVSLMEPIPFAVLSLAVGAVPLAWPELSSGGISRLWDRRYALRLMALGFFGTTVTSLLMFYASLTVPASRIVILSQVEILYSLAFGAFALGERIGGKHIAAVSLILAGMVIALRAGPLDGLGRGELMIMAMPFCFQISHIISKGLLAELGPMLISAARTIYGLLFLLPLLPWFVAPRALAAPFLDPRALGVVLFQGLVINALSLWLWYKALARIDLSRLTPLILTYPLVTLLAVKFVPGIAEPVEARQFFGAALVILGARFLARLEARPASIDKVEEVKV